MWRAIRYGLSGELIDLERGDVLPARARIERLIEWVLPVAGEIGAADWLRLPEQNAAERQIARCGRARAWPRSTAGWSFDRAGGVTGARPRHLLQDAPR